MIQELEDSISALFRIFFVWPFQFPRKGPRKAGDQAGGSESFKGDEASRGNRGKFFPVSFVSSFFSGVFSDEEEKTIVPTSSH